MQYETSALRSPHLTPRSSEIRCAWWGLIWPRDQGQVILQGPVAKEGQEKAAPVVEHSRGRVREMPYWKIIVKMIRCSCYILESRKSNL